MRDVSVATWRVVQVRLLSVRTKTLQGGAVVRVGAHFGAGFVVH
jgi:hypothetical protein